MLTKDNLPGLFESFSKLKVLVIGDVMIDSYLWGKVDRISPEAPVPVVTVSNRENRLGGAANVALNIQSLGAFPIMCSVIGDDQKGEQFNCLMQERGLSTAGIVRCSSRITTTKFRIIGNNTQMLRVDEEVTSDLTEEETKGMVQTIFSLLDSEKPHVILFEDYDKGVISASLIHAVVSKARRMNIPVVVDPKKRNFNHYIDITLFKPNLKEMKEGLKLDAMNTDMNTLSRVSASLQAKQNIDILLITLAEKGVLVSYRDFKRKYIPELIPAEIRNIADVSGAGDTVISTAAICLALGMEPLDIAFLSNLAGGLVCEEVGVVPVNKEKLFAETMARLPDVHNPIV
jgi:rfaE bifunctional protein kinase chain/domain